MTALDFRHFTVLLQQRQAIFSNCFQQGKAQFPIWLLSWRTRLLSTSEIIWASITSALTLAPVVTMGRIGLDGQRVDQLGIGPNHTQGVRHQFFGCGRISIERSYCFGREATHKDSQLAK